MLPDLALYICFRQALVMRKAPSRWIASSRFQSANGKSTIGLTIWMPALLTSTSIRPYFAIVSAMPFSTAVSSATFMPTAKASEPLALISRAVASAASRLRSAMTGVPPSAAKRSAISLPMPLAAPVIMATFLAKRDISALLSGVSQVIEHDLAKTQRQVRHIVGSRNHLTHRQPRHVAQRVLEELDRSRPRPGSLHRDVFHVIAHQLADPRRAVDMRDDLDHEVRSGQRLQQRRGIQLAMLETHRGGDAQHRAVVQGTDHNVAFMRHLRAPQLFGEAPDLAPAGDRRVVVEVHGVDIAAFLHRAVPGREPHRDYLARFGVVAKAGGVRHADKFIGDRVGGYFQRLWHHLTQSVDVGAIGDDHEFPIVEFVRARRIGRVVQRHGECIAANFGEFHLWSLLNGNAIAKTYSRPSRARSKVNTPSISCGRCNTSGWRRVRTASW